MADIKILYRFKTSKNKILKISCFNSTSEFRHHNIKNVYKMLNMYVKK